MPRFEKGSQEAKDYMAKLRNKKGIEGGSLTEKQKMKITKDTNIQEITEERADKDYEKLRKIDCNNIDELSQAILTGNNFVDYFTKIRRLETASKKGISFYDLMETKSKYRGKNWIDSYLEKYGDTTASWLRIFSLYFGSISVFKPIVAMNVYCKYKPRSVLDFTMGWGGRLVGACALNVERYTGIDMNTSLKKHYDNMVDKLKEHTTTKITLLFKNALKVDYSKIDYDLVLTSPPYYNIETYKGQQKMDKDKWDAEFYEPIFTKTWKHLKKGGYYCLNVPEEVFTRVCLKVLGKPTEYIPLHKNKRRPDETYKEFIYVWRK